MKNIRLYTQKKYKLCFMKHFFVCMYMLSPDIILNLGKQKNMKNKCFI